MSHGSGSQRAEFAIGQLRMMQHASIQPGLIPLSSENEDGLADVLTFVQSVYGGMADTRDGFAGDIEHEKETEAKRDLLSIDDFDDELSQLIDWGIRMKNDDGFADAFKPLDGMSIGSIYEKPSTRTRVSFEVGVSKLGGQPLTLLANDIQLGKVSP